MPVNTPSSASTSDVDKVSAAGEQTDIDVGSSDPIDTSAKNASEKQEEKDGSLARQPTAVSNSGKKVEQVKTREDGAEYPGGMTLGLVVLALCLSVFTMALGKRTAGWLVAVRLTSSRRQFHHRDCNPQDHR